MPLSHSTRHIEDNLTRECVTYFCPGHLTKFKGRKLCHYGKTITYLTFSPDGCELLVNMGGEQIYLYNLHNAEQPVVRIQPTHLLISYRILLKIALSFQFLSLPQFNKSHDATNDDVSSSASQETSTETASATASAASSSVFYTKLSKLPKHIDEMKRSGNDFMGNEKYLQAVNQYSDCIELMPNHPIFYLNRATAYMRRQWNGDVYSALRDCRQALQLDPTYVKAHFRLARALFELDFVTEASECLDELKKRFPNDAGDRQIQLLAQDIESDMMVNE